MRLKELEERRAEIVRELEEKSGERDVANAAIAVAVVMREPLPNDYAGAMLTRDKEIASLELGIEHVEHRIREKKADIALKQARLTSRRQEPLMRERHNVSAMLHSLIESVANELKKGRREPEDFWEKRKSFENRLAELAVELSAVEEEATSIAAA